MIFTLIKVSIETQNLTQTIQRFSRPNIGFTLGNFIELYHCHCNSNATIFDRHFANWFNLLFYSSNHLIYDSNS